MSGLDPDSTREVSDLSPYASAGPALVALGYSAIPISPAEKMPGRYSGGQWWMMKDWSRHCVVLPTGFEVTMWSKWPEANVGVAMGRGVLAFDIDQDFLIDPIKAVLPPCVVAKRGRKGETLFFRGDTSAIRSRGFKRQRPGSADPRDREGMMDLIADGKQTVVPPSIHPDTAAPYVWTTERTLRDTPPADLTEITVEHVEAVIEVLRAHGYEAPETFLPVEARGESIFVDEPGLVLDSAQWYRKLNDDALADLHAWVPRLGLTRLQRSGAGYRSVAEWRPSSTGKPLHKRNLYLSIDPKGIVDYGDCEKGYTALNLVMAALNIPETDLNRAVVWLGEAIGWDLQPVRLNAGRKLLPSRHEAHRLLSRRGAARPESSRTPDDPLRSKEVWHTNERRARQIWIEGKSPLGTPAEDYLAERGIRIPAPLADSVLRFHPGTSQELAEAALLALIRNIHSDNPQGVLAVPIERSDLWRRKEGIVIGEAVQGAIKLDADAQISMGLTIGQGIEDCMAWRQLGFSPVWAVCWPGNIDRFPVIAGIEALTILTRGEEQGSNRRAALKCADRWHRAGRTTALAKPRLAGGMTEVLRRVS